MPKWTSVPVRSRCCRLTRGRVTPVSGARDEAHARAGVLRDRRLPRR